MDGHGRRPGINLQAWTASSHLFFSNCLDAIHAAWMASRQLLKPHATSTYTVSDYSIQALYQHFISASQDTKRESKEKAMYSGLAKRLMSCSHFVLNLALMFDALKELAELSLELQKRDVTLPSAHRAVTRQIVVFKAMCA